MLGRAGASSDLLSLTRKIDVSVSLILQPIPYNINRYNPKKKNMDKKTIREVAALWKRDKQQYGEEYNPLAE